MINKSIILHGLNFDTVLLTIRARVTLCMGSPRARDRGGYGLLYSPPRLFSTKYARNAQYARGPPSLHDPTHFLITSSLT